MDAEYGEGVAPPDVTDAAVDSIMHPFDSLQARKQVRRVRRI
jgi:hypothetical protein